jgi:RNA-directed DNA polymerase
MMNGPEKSDSAIVATKLANKAEPSAERSAGEPYAAEPVERRAGTKGNAGQQSTRRTQSRESVSQALERIREVAKERRRSSPRSSTTSTSICSKRRSTNLRRMLHPAWIG